MSIRKERFIQVLEKRQKSNKGKWYWNCKAGNGRIIFTSGETFNTKYHCKRQAQREYEICIKAKVPTSYREIKL